jgi:hypothetical protein
MVPVNDAKVLRAPNAGYARRLVDGDNRNGKRSAGVGFSYALRAGVVALFAHAKELSSELVGARGAHRPHRRSQDACGRWRADHGRRQSAIDFASALRAGGTVGDGRLEVIVAGPLVALPSASV